MRRVMQKMMSTMNWMVLALLAVTITAVAQQPASAPQNPQTVAATKSEPTAAQPSAAPSDQAQASLAPPTTMDQVVDRVITREKDLIKFLTPRTPIVETYLQNLTQDPQLGPIPQDDHYFLGRMDVSDSIDRSDYLQEKGKGEGEGMEKRLLGGITKRFKFQYQPLGFSWMIFADRNDFDRQHYNFHYARREFLGDVRCLIFNPDTAEKASASSVFFRCQIEYQASHVAEKLASRVVKIVVLPVKVVAVGEDHPRKAQGLVLELESLRDSAQKTLLHPLAFALAFFLKVVAPVDRVAQVHASEKVMIILRDWPQLRILRQVLQISFHNWRARRQKLDQILLACNHAIDNLIHRGRRRQACLSLI